MHIVANRRICRYNPFTESANKQKIYARRVSSGQNTLGNTICRLFVHRRSGRTGSLLGSSRDSGPQCTSHKVCKGTAALPLHLNPTPENEHAPVVVASALEPSTPLGRVHFSGFWMQGSSTFTNLVLLTLRSTISSTAGRTAHGRTQTRADKPAHCANWFVILGKPLVVEVCGPRNWFGCWFGRHIIFKIRW